MNMDEMLDSLAMNEDNVTPERAALFGFSVDDWLQRREELINCPPDSEAPEWAEWKAQDANGDWLWHEFEPRASDSQWDGEGEIDTSGRIGRVPLGHNWRTTLTRINRDDNTSTPEEEEEFARIQARQDAERPHEADARMLDAQLERDIATFREVYKIAEDECVELYGRDRQEPDAHYRHEYKGIKLDPYRIAKIYNMDGGPREQIMKKTLRFTDKGQTEQQVVNEIRTALDRWQQMIDEDK